MFFSFFFFVNLWAAKKYHSSVFSLFPPLNLFLSISFIRCGDKGVCVCVCVCACVTERKKGKESEKERARGTDCECVRRRQRRVSPKAGFITMHLSERQWRSCCQWQCGTELKSISIFFPLHPHCCLSVCRCLSSSLTL